MIMHDNSINNAIKNNDQSNSNKDNVNNHNKNNKFHIITIITEYKSNSNHHYLDQF